MKPPRTYGLLVACLAALGISACGGSSGPSRPAPGTPQNPLQAEVSQPAIKADGTTTKAIGSRNNEAQAPVAASKNAKPTRSARTVTGSGVGRKGESAYQTLVDRQTSHPQSRLSVCNLVSVNQARAIVGAPMQAPIEAPQGPTCIYRTQTGKRLIAVAVQTLDFERLRPLIRKPQRVTVSNRSGFCGTYGQSMLYLPLSRGRVLSITASCNLAKGFALRALPHL